MAGMLEWGKNENTEYSDRRQKDKTRGQRSEPQDLRDADTRRFSRSIPESEKAIITKARKKRNTKKSFDRIYKIDRIKGRISRKVCMDSLS